MFSFVPEACFNLSMGTIGCALHSGQLAQGHCSLWWQKLVAERIALGHVAVPHSTYINPAAQGQHR
jgi:hypothetical protein